MNKGFAPFLLFVLITLGFLLNACSSSNKITDEMPGGMNIVDMPSHILYNDFNAAVVSILMDPPLDLTIDTTYDDTIHASEVYDGRVHRHWFFWKTTWKEKTCYYITYRRAENNTVFTLRSASFETQDASQPNARWHVVQPSVKTKENQILQQLR